MDVNDIELFSTTDLNAKNSVVSMLVRNRISYLERWEKISIFRRREYGGARELCVIYVNGNQYDKAKRILEDFNIEFGKKKKKKKRREREEAERERAMALAEEEAQRLRHEGNSDGGDGDDDIDDDIDNF